MGLNEVTRGFIQVANTYFGNTTMFLFDRVLLSYLRSYKELPVNLEVMKVQLEYESKEDQILVLQRQRKFKNTKDSFWDSKPHLSQ